MSDCREFGSSIGMNEYQCAACHSVFVKGCTDEEALAELGELFPGFAPADCALICDDCFKKMGFDK